MSMLDEIKARHVERAKLYAGGVGESSKGYLWFEDITFLLQEVERQERGRKIALQALHESSEREIKLRKRLGEE